MLSYYFPYRRDADRIKQDIIVFKMYMPNSYYVLYRNGYYFGGYYWPLYYKYGNTKFFDGTYINKNETKGLPMLGLVDDKYIAFIFYDYMEQEEYLDGVPLKDPKLVKVFPATYKIKVELYFNEYLCDEYNKTFNTNFKCPENPVIVETVPFCTYQEI